MDEAKILASVGGTVKDMSQYEDHVIQRAERDAAPKLMGASRFSSSLEPLAPSYSNRTQRSNPAADLKHFHTILQKVRSELLATDSIESHRSQVLRLKEQMILVYLQDKLPRDEFPVQVPREVAAEHQRKFQLANGNTSAIIVEPPAGDRKRKAVSKRTSASIINDINGDSNSHLTMEQRLQVIKDGEASSSPRKRSRKSMQAWKQQIAGPIEEKEEDERERRKYLKQRRKERQRKRRQRLAQLLGGGVINSDDDDDEVEFHTEFFDNNVKTSSTGVAAGETPPQISQKQQQLAPVKGKSNTSSVANTQVVIVIDSDGDEQRPISEPAAAAAIAPTMLKQEPQEVPDAALVPIQQQLVEVKDEVNTSSAANTQELIVIDSDDDEHRPISEPAAAAVAPTLLKQEPQEVPDAALVPPQQQQGQEEVACPLCGQQVPYTNVSNPDLVLSEHIEACQRGDAGGGKERRITRTRTRKQPAVNYGEDNDDEDGGKKVTQTRSGKKSPVAGEDYQFENEVDEDLVSTQPQPVITRRRRSSTRTSFSPRKNNIALPLQPTITLGLDDMEEWVYEDRVDGWIENGLSKMKKMAERDENEVPPGSTVYPGNLLVPAWVNNRLFPYQRVALRWMWELHQQEAGGIVGDEMGLGKTVQVCSYLGCMAASRKLKSVLVVCPATMLQHWLKELSIWSPGLRRILIHKSGETDGLSREISPLLLKAMTKWLKRARADRVYEAIDEKDFEDDDEGAFVGTGYAFVTTYENLRRSPDIWTSQRWSYVVLDEGQKVRNPDADITLTCKRLRTPHRLLLSGTPIQNDLKELWTLFDFVFPGRLGTLPAFESEFAEPIKRGGFSNASPMQVQLAYRCALVLKDLINPYLLRRQKKDVKEVSRMPGKTEQVLFCRLSKKQRQLYEAYLRSDEVVNILRGSSQLFRSITILRKISNHPDLVCDPKEAAYDNFVRHGYSEIPDSGDSGDEDLDDFQSLVERSGKLEVLGKILPLWKKQGHRVLIFCQWTKMLNILQRFMMMNQWKFGRMDGKTSVASRQKLVDSFNTDESYFALLMTTRTGGVGLNLTGADRVIIYDPDWNPQTDSQARARSHRFGQKKPVTIYRLITAGTIEEKIYHRQIFKTALTNRVLQDPKQKRLFSQRDLTDFFTLKADDGSIIKGGTGMTELGAITRGRGVINPEEVARGGGSSDGSEGDGNDDKETLETVMKSKGLAGVFDHEFVDTSDGVKKTTSARDMEEKAKQVAANAVRALKASAREQGNRFEPTWTGSNETGGRFGHGNQIARPSSAGILRRPEPNGNFGRAGFAQEDPGGTAPSSKRLLAGLKGMNIAKSSSNGDDDNGGNVRFADLLKRIKGYVRRCGGYRAGGGPTTDEVLKEFSDIPTNESAIFRRLLNSVAKVERGKWRLQE